MSKHFKMIVKEFVRSMGRFLAICAIIALGVGFLIGLMDATPDMKRTLNAYYDEAAFSDIQMKSSLGFFADDIDAIISAHGVKGAEPFNSLDKIIYGTNTPDRVGRLIGADFENQSYNRLTLTEGRYPIQDGECVALRGNTFLRSYTVGEKIIVRDGEQMTRTTFTVTGIVTSAEFMTREEAERTAVGNGRVGAVLYVQPEAFSVKATQELVFLLGGEKESGVKVGDDMFTDCAVTLNNGSNYDAFTQEYDDYAKAQAADLSDLGVRRLKIRTDAMRETIEKYGLQGLVSEEQLDSYKWYSLDRTQNVSYASLNANIDKVRGIAGIFPVFFILVAGLVALTTMRKTVEDDRTQIGMLKAIGYSKGRIISKYLLYCGLATLLGCGLGIACGFALLPSLIWQAYGSMYYLPQLAVQFNWIVSTIATVVAFAATALVTVFACLHSMKERPATLMLPKAPKAGKRIWLERIGFMWKPMAFKHKAMFRNIFRYKGNMLMTVLGVAGCTALLLTGFGFSDSVSAFSNRQFDAVTQYQLAIDVKTHASNYDGGLVDYLDAHDSISIVKESGNLLIGGKTEPIIIVAAERELSDFILLKARNSKKPLELSGDRVIVSENLANGYRLKVGQEIALKSDGITQNFVIGGITENYVDCYVYMPRALYTDRYGETTDNRILVKTQIAETDALTEQILGYSAVSGLEVIARTRQSYENLLSSMNQITIILIVCAGALAMIVLYNLLNNNIDERKKELATLKVLGYRPIEVAGYVYREATLLTVIGALIGLGLGVLLHLFLITQVETVAMMFGRAINWWSYLLALVLTMGFAAIVDLILAPKLSRIKMVDSMKAYD